MLSYWVKMFLGEVNPEINYSQRITETRDFPGFFYNTAGIKVRSQLADLDGSAKDNP